MKHVKTNAPYAKTWGTPIGKDCVSLDTTLCRWLGERLCFLSEHTQSAPFGYADTPADAHEVAHDRWAGDLYVNGEKLLAWSKHFVAGYDMGDEALAYTEAQDALRWVAEHLGHLWD